MNRLYFLERNRPVSIGVHHHHHHHWHHAGTHRHPAAPHHAWAAVSSPTHPSTGFIPVVVAQHPPVHVTAPFLPGRAVAIVFSGIGRGPGRIIRRGRLLRCP